MSCRKNSPGNPCCANPDCETACTGEDTPLSVTLTLPWSLDGTAPTEQTFTLVNRGLIDGPCSKYQANIECGEETDWFVLEDRSCVSDWPASNVNDTVYAVGTGQGCLSCSGYFPATQTLYYEEQQLYGRTTTWRKLSYSARFSIEPLGTDGSLRLRFGANYGESLARTYVLGARNRVKIVTITCTNGQIPNGIVTDLTDWIVADEPVLPDPSRCVRTRAVLCGEGVSAFFAGSCSESQESIGTFQYGCNTSSIDLRTSVGEPWCNEGPFGDDIVGCDFILGPFLYNINGQAESGGGDRFGWEWSAIIDCHDLFTTDPIVLTGGPVSGVVTLPFAGTPSISLGPATCTWSGSYGSRSWSVPTTISVKVNAV